jgi:starvation-inducible DNA-binding protein
VLEGNAKPQAHRARRRDRGTFSRPQTSNEGESAPKFDGDFERRVEAMAKDSSSAAARMERSTSAAASGLSPQGVAEISNALRPLLADVFALYLKTKNFHWHMTGSHFRDYHLLLDEQAEQVFAMTDDIAERARKIGGTTLHSISDITKHQRLTDNNQDGVSAEEMLSELRGDNRALTQYLRDTHELCAKYNDVATTSLIEVWIDQTERRTWFLAEVAGGS